MHWNEYVETYCGSRRINFEIKLVKNKVVELQSATIHSPSSSTSTIMLMPVERVAIWTHRLVGAIEEAQINGEMVI